MQADGRLSNAAIAEQVGLTTSTVFERIKKLEKKEIIQRYVAVVDAQKLGKPITAFDKRGDWALGLGYRHVESDAVIDGFTDSVFGFGGTNMEGYSLNAAMALSKRTWVRMAYMSADQIAGPQLRTDVFLFEFTAKF